MRNSVTPVAQRGKLGGEAEDRDTRDRVRFLVQPVRQFLRQPFDQRVEFGGNLRDEVLRAVFALERGTPDLSPPAFGEVAEILAETLDEVGLGEKRVDREIDLQFLVQFQQALADGVGVGGQLVRREGQHVLDADREDDAVDRLLGRLSFRSDRKDSQLFRSVSASESWVV